MREPHRSPCLFVSSVPNNHPLHVDWPAPHSLLGYRVYTRPRPTKTVPGTPMTVKLWILATTASSLAASHLTASLRLSHTAATPSFTSRRKKAAVPSAPSPAASAPGFWLR